MEFQIKDRKHILIAKKGEVACSNCKKEEQDHYYYCEINKTIYCSECVNHSIKTPCSIHSHNDYFIDEIKIINGGEQQNEQNKESI